MSAPLFTRKTHIGAGGRNSEKRVAKALGGKLTPASGAMPGAKGDFTAGRFLFEAKATKAASLSLLLDWLLKIRGEARSRNLLPAVAVSFTHDDGSERDGGDWVLMRRQDFEDLTRGG